MHKSEDRKVEQRTMHLEAKIDEIVAKKKEIREESWAKERADDLSNTQRVWEPHEVHGDPPGTVNLNDSMVTPAYTPECIEGDSKYHALVSVSKMWLQRRTLLTKGDVVQNTTRDGIVLNALANSVSQIFRRLFTTITNPMNNNFEFQYFIGDNSTVGIECEKDPHSNVTRVMFRLGRHLANAAEIRPLPKPYGTDQSEMTYTIQFPDIVMRVIIDFMLRRFKLGYKHESVESQTEWTQLLDSLVSEWRAAELRLRDVQAQNNNLYRVHNKERREQQKMYRELKERYDVALGQWEEERRASAALRETVTAVSAISEQRRQTIEACNKENKQLHADLEH